VNFEPMTVIPKDVEGLMASEQWSAIVLSIDGVVLLLAFYLINRLSSSQRWLWIPSSCMYILAGVVMVCLQRISFPQFDPAFDSRLFFLALLPPVIFNSGLEIDLLVFFQNYDAIMVFANLGTIINAVVVGLFMYAVGVAKISPLLSLSEVLTFGSVVSATDPVTTIAVFERFKVDPQLYTIIVGVSVLDDAISVLLFNIFRDFIRGELSLMTVVQSMLLFLVKLFGSMMIGYSFGVAFAHVIHWQLFVSNSSLLITFSICMVLLMYSVPEALTLSGIITTMLAGIAFQKTCKDHLKSISSEEEVISPFHIVRSLINNWSFLFESLVFVYIGYTILHHAPQASSYWTFTFWSLLACVFGRMAQIYPLSWTMNTFHGRKQSFSKDHHLLLVDDSADLNDPQSPHSPEVDEIRNPSLSLGVGCQHMMMLAGLRGPIAFATAQLFPDTYGHQNLAAFATAVIVVVTTGLFGALTMPALDFLRINHGQEFYSNQGAAPVVSGQWYLRWSEAATKFLLRALYCPTLNDFHQAIERDRLNSNGVSRDIFTIESVENDDIVTL
jgi:NhaP-type Na+/H+ or K+/H+ antiporter